MDGRVPRFRRLFRAESAGAAPAAAATAAARHAAFEGALAGSGLRGIAWKVFLGVLPAGCPPEEWGEVGSRGSPLLPLIHISYARAVIRRDGWLRRRAWVLSWAQVTTANPHDHELSQNQMDPPLNNPLCPAKDSPWALWEEATRVREVVTLDVKRLLPGSVPTVQPLPLLSADLSVPVLLSSAQSSAIRRLITAACGVLGTRSSLLQLCGP
eukprot:COSAG01_NODE_9670_length_2374_cov_1.341978_3_plen_212_part_00